MPITIFGETTLKYNQPQINLIPQGTTLPDLSSFVTKDQVHDKKYLNKNFIKRDVIGTTSASITLHNHRRIAAIKPGIDANDAVNKKQMEDHNHQIAIDIKDRIQKAIDECTKIGDDLSRERRSRDKDITSVIYFNGTLSNNIFVPTGGQRFFPILCDGSIVKILTNLDSQLYEVFQNSTIIDHRRPFNVLNEDKLYFKSKLGAGLQDGYKIHVYLFVKFPVL